MMKNPINARNAQKKMFQHIVQKILKKLGLMTESAGNDQNEFSLQRKFVELGGRKTKEGM